MRCTPTLVTLHAGSPGKSLELRRAPKYLRFVIVGTDPQTLDALDQLDDRPKASETVMAAIRQEGSSGSVHLDYSEGGRRKSKWLATASYRLIEPQPPAEILRDTAKWREWCYAQPPSKPQGEHDARSQVQGP